MTQNTITTEILSEWHEPLAYLAGLDAAGEQEYTLLYSSMRTLHSGRYSLLALHPDKTIESEDFSELTPELTTHLPRYANCWFGYLGYGLKQATEMLTLDTPSHIHLPALRMTRFATILLFDHEERIITAYRSHNALSLPLPHSIDDYHPHGEELQVTSLASDMSKATYFANVARIKEEIAHGTLYQANLTRKFYGTYDHATSPAKLFHRLCHISPAPYSAFMKFGTTAILSSSPECFLSLATNSHVETRPIKGSAARYADPLEDEAARRGLIHSEKDRAENLMIVDLMRNDLSRSCETGSVKVDTLFEVNSYATVHHMSSTIIGTRKADVMPLQLIANCFPPGSMTGTPKIRAMELCSELEPRARGVYSGAIGWLGGDGSGELSVVIRTLITQGERFEFQVGGAIINDSTPEGEWEETLVKARGLATTLHIPLSQLRKL